MPEMLKLRDKWTITLAYSASMRIVLLLLFAANAAGAINWKVADGTGKEGLLKSVPNRFLHPGSWSANGKSLIMREFFIPAENADIGMISMEGDHKWEPLLKGKYNELQPKVSPKGQWIAYTSDESGQNEVYVQQFPEVDKMRRQVSISGGDSPLWSPDGKELFYRNGEAIMAVSIKTGTDFN
jgi:eukaryotic-like serine/threonine-protein kinase